MNRIITEELFNKVIKLLMQDEKVQVFQSLLMSEKQEEPAQTPEENKGAE